MRDPIDGFDPMVILADAIEKLAESIDKLALTQARPMSSGGPSVTSPVPATVPPPMAVGGPPGADSAQVKKGKKVFAICKKHAWDIAAIGEQITGRKIGPDSRQWSDADLNAVLKQLDEWEKPQTPQYSGEPF